MQSPIKFKYHPGGTIYQDGQYICSFADYIAANPTCGLVQGNFFEQLEDGTISYINDEGHHRAPLESENPEISDFLSNPYPSVAEILDQLRPSPPLKPARTSLLKYSPDGYIYKSGMKADTFVQYAKTNPYFSQLTKDLFFEFFSDGSLELIDARGNSYPINKTVPNNINIINFINNMYPHQAQPQILTPVEMVDTTNKLTLRKLNN